MQIDSKKINRDLILNGSMFSAILSLAIPVVINSFLQTMYNLTDTFWLGQIGTNQLSAINLVTPLQNIVVSFGGGITTAGSVLIAQLTGAKKNDEAKKMANQIYFCAILFAIVCAGLIFIITPELVTWLGADGLTHELSTIYLRIVILDMPLLFTVNIYQAIHQAQGDTLSPMLLNFLGIIVNMGLDPLLMIYFGMDAAGAALATVLAKAVPACVALILLSKKNNSVRLEFKLMRPEKEIVKSIAKLGLPTAIGQSTMQFGFLLMSRTVFSFGDSAMAAYGIGNKVNGLISLPSNGIGSATAIIVGQNMGANKPRRAELGYRMAVIICVSFLAIGGFILSRPLISTSIVSIFSKDKNVIKMASDFLSLMAFWCFFNGVHNPSTGLFNGTGHTGVTMIIDAARLWVFRFATIFVCRNVLNMGVESIWYSVVVSNGIAATILFILYLTGIWKVNKVKI